LTDTPFKIHDDIKFECASLIAGWHEDAGNLGYGVLKYLKNNLQCRLMAEIEPTGYWPMNNILISDDVARFPESKLYYCPDKALLLFLSHSPNADWYRFLNTIIDMAGYHCRLQQVYTMGGMINLNAHTAARHISAVVSSSDMKQGFAGSDVEIEMDYETPVGQRPTLSSFLMWTARQRDIPAVSLWGPVPFYLAGLDDPRSWRPILTFLDERLKLGLNFTELEGRIKTQDEKIAIARGSNPELEELFKRLESGQMLSPEENDQLVGDLEEIFETDE